MPALMRRMSAPNNPDDETALTAEELLKLLAEGRKLRFELEKRVEEMRVPSYEQMKTRVS